MKKLITLFAITTLLVVSSLSSCTKKTEDPTPTDTTGTGTTKTPTVTCTTTGSMIAPANINFTATVADLVSDSISKVELLDGTTVLATLTTSPCTFTRNSLTAGVYNYTVRLTAKNGTVVDKTVTFTIIAPNLAPVFSGTDLGLLTLSPGSTTQYNANVSTLVSDPESSTLTVTTVTTTSSVTIGSISGTSFVVTAPSSVFAGQVTLVVSVSDGVNTTTSNVTVTLGSTAQAATYGILTPFFNKVLSNATPAGLTIYSNGNIGSSVSNSFWSSTTCTTGTWSINSDGTMKISNSCNGGTFNYTVSTSNTGGYNWIVLTNVNGSFTASGR